MTTEHFDSCVLLSLEGKEDDLMCKYKTRGGSARKQLDSNSIELTPLVLVKDERFFMGKEK